MSSFQDEMSLSNPSDYDQEDSSIFLLDDTTTEEGDTTAPKDASSSDGHGYMGDFLGRRATLNVNRSKCLVYLVLALAAIGFGMAVFVLLKGEEQDDFETQFGDFSQEILANAEANARDFLGQLKKVSNTITSYSLDTGAQWANVTLPHFDIRTTDAFEKLAGAEVYIFAPIVTKQALASYEQYAWDHQGWIQQDLELRGLGKVNPGLIPNRVYPSTGELEAHLNAIVHVPIWQLAPPPTDATIINLDLYSHPSFRRMIDECTQVRHILLSEVVDRTFISENIDTLDSNSEMDQHPRSYAVQPVFRDFSFESELVGFVFAVVPWWTYFVDVLPVGTQGYVVEVQDSCGSPFFYRLDGPDASYLEAFSPNPDFQHLAPAEEFAEFARFTGETSNDDIQHCSYRVVIHPTTELKEAYQTSKPVAYTVIVIAVFAITVMVFILYDHFVQQRQDKVMRTAQKTSAIVSSLFPKNVRKRIMTEMNETSSRGSRSRRFSGKDLLKSFFQNDMQEEETDTTENGVFLTKPIADYFSATTVLFGDIVGFTAWSSMREPQAVFTLLETIYHEFDKIALRRSIFKVETIGDSYVAVSGCPDPRPNHALAIAKFAMECLTRLRMLLKKLEVELGPDTADLGMRFGLHSGPVTAGVLRGERARFQLFGDTVNTAARMESTGAEGQIQVSQETAELLIRAGKQHWVTPRDDLVQAKGKGTLQTYWLKTSTVTSTGSCTHKSDNSSDDDLTGTNGATAGAPPRCGSFVSKAGQRVEITAHRLGGKSLRLVEWNVDLMFQMLKEMEARRLSTGVVPDDRETIGKLEYQIMNQSDLVITEVQEIITLPDFTHESTIHNSASIQFDGNVRAQLQEYIVGIASMYHRANPFHNFEHASHVTMSVVKLFSRIVAPDKDKLADEDYNEKSLHDHTFGLTSDPMTQFAATFSALIHDVDHLGVPNTRLTQENLAVAGFYQNQSIAEQNSVDLAWSYLMKSEFQDLRRAIYKTEAELQRFRALVVNAVLATDIMDQELKSLRNNRWDKAFSSSSSGRWEEEKETANANANNVIINRKATIVIEHLMQASDVSHTMQHWRIYRKWNARLFEELYKAYMEGRAENDPSTFWYKGEIGFLDFYVIPLAKKLAECGVFGVSSQEYHQYAVQNRNEWVRRGEAMVQEMVQNIQSQSSYTDMSSSKKNRADRDCDQEQVQEQVQEEPGSAASASVATESSSSDSGGASSAASNQEGSTRPTNTAINKSEETCIITAATVEC